MKTHIIPIVAFLGLMAIPLILCAIAVLRLFAGTLNRAGESEDVTGINAIPAEWPSDSLSREYGNEYEPRGM